LGFAADKKAVFDADNFWETSGGSVVRGRRGCLKRFDANDVEQIDSDRSFVKGLSRLSCQADHGRPLAYPQQIGVTDLKASAIRHYETKGLEGMLT
jgi:hypothetical protein